MKILRNRMTIWQTRTPHATGRVKFDLIGYRKLNGILRRSAARRGGQLNSTGGAKKRTGIDVRTTAKMAVAGTRCGGIFQLLATRNIKTICGQKFAHALIADGTALGKRITIFETPCIR